MLKAPHANVSGIVINAKLVFLFPALLVATKFKNSIQARH
jgi:hypothetical protein